MGRPELLSGGRVGAAGGPEAAGACGGACLSGGRVGAVGASGAWELDVAAARGAGAAGAGTGVAGAGAVGAGGAGVAGAGGAGALALAAGRAGGAGGGCAISLAGRLVTRPERAARTGAGDGRAAAAGAEIRCVSSAGGTSALAAAGRGLTSGIWACGFSSGTSSVATGRLSPSLSAFRRTRSACASSMEDEWLLTPIPRDSARSSASLLLRPSSRASS